MQNLLKAAPRDTSCYSDSEVTLMRQQLKTGHEEASVVFTAEEFPLDPRIVAEIQKLAKPT